MGPSRAGRPGNAQSWQIRQQKMHFHIECTVILLQPSWNLLGLQPRRYQEVQHGFSMICLSGPRSSRETPISKAVQDSGGNALWKAASSSQRCHLWCRLQIVPQGRPGPQVGKQLTQKAKEPLKFQAPPEAALGYQSTVAAYAGPMSSHHETIFRSATYLDKF